jgi:dihydroorotate dehydrogenase (fumarate)
MADLSTTYMGLKLRNPIIAGSSGMTRTVENIVEVEKNGGGAVVMKSLFEEQIRLDINRSLNQSSVDTPYGYAEALDYISNYSRENAVGEYLNTIREAKSRVSIPIIASINCTSPHEWITFARKVQEAGADALELNIFILPSDPRMNGEENKQIYLDIIQSVLKQITIPLAVKISYYFSDLSKFSLKLSWTGISGLVLFNRFFSPDIDIEHFKVTATNVLSTPEELAMSLRWVAILSDKVHCDIAASTGIHDGKAVIKQLLAGARAVQCVSALYNKGYGHIGTMLTELEEWMVRHNYGKIEDFCGMMSFKKAENPAPYERVQFMKHFAGIE